MILEEFLKMDKQEAVKYDFKKEIFQQRNLDYHNFNEVERVLIYKGNIFQKESDCDRLPLTFSIYNTIWGDEINRYFDIENAESFLPSNGETMHSFTRIYKIYTDIIKQNNRYQFECIELNKFAELTHSLGNFIPVYSIYEKNASPFNASRNASTHDYWDLTMLDIKNYFANKQEFVPKYIRNSSNWFETYRNDSFDNGFNEFCNKHFLYEWKLIDNETDSEWNKRNLFWEHHETKRHTVSHFSIEGGEEIFRKILTRINQSIITRGELMYDKLKEEFEKR